MWMSNYTLDRYKKNYTLDLYNALKNEGIEITSHNEITLYLHVSLSYLQQKFYL